MNTKEKLTRIVKSMVVNKDGKTIGDVFLFDFIENLVNHLVENDVNVSGTDDKALKLYAVRDTKTGKLISNITNPRRKYWDRKGNAMNAILNAPWYRRETLELVTFKLVEVTEDA